jgi:hypothetical protein
MNTLYNSSCTLHLFKLSYRTHWPLFSSDEHPVQFLLYTPSTFSYTGITGGLPLFRPTSCIISLVQSICLSSQWALSLSLSLSHTHKHTHTHTRLSDLFHTRFSYSNFESFGLSFVPLIQGISQTFVQISVVCESSTLSIVSVDGPRAPRIAGCMSFKVARIRNRRQETPYGM